MLIALAFLASCGRGGSEVAQTATPSFPSLQHRAHYLDSLANVADCEAEPLREWLDEMQYVEHPSRAQLDSLWYVKEQSDILERRTMLLLGRLMEVEEMCQALYGRSPL